MAVTSGASAPFLLRSGLSAFTALIGLCHFKSTCIQDNVYNFVRALGAEPCGKISEALCHHYLLHQVAWVIIVFDTVVLWRGGYEGCITDMPPPLSMFHAAGCLRCWLDVRYCPDME